MRVIGTRITAKEEGFSGHRLDQTLDRRGRVTGRRILVDDVLTAAKNGKLPGHPREGWLLSEGLESKLDGQKMIGEGNIEPLTETRPDGVIGWLSTMKLYGENSGYKDWGGSHQLEFSPPADVYANGDIILRDGTEIKCTTILEDEHPPQ